MVIDAAICKRFHILKGEQSNANATFDLNI
jgi:hypothetical protein